MINLCATPLQPPAGTRPLLLIVFDHDANLHPVQCAHEDVGSCKPSVLSGCRGSSQQAASDPPRGRSNGSLLLSAAFDVLRCATEDWVPADAAGGSAARSAVVMGQCLMAALALARPQPHIAPLSLWSALDTIFSIHVAS